MIENYLFKLLETKTQYGRPHSPVTVRRHYNMLNQIYNMAIRERITIDNPCRVVSCTVLKKLPTWQNRERWLNKYSLDEEERLFAAFNYGEHLPAFCRIVLNTGIRPPKEVLAIKKEHVNLSDEVRYCRVEKTDVLIPPRAVLVAMGKDLRHTFATRLLKRGVHQCVISALLGHSTPVVGGGFGSRTINYFKTKCGLPSLRCLRKLWRWIRRRTSWRRDRH